MQLEIDTPRSVYYRGEEIEGTIRGQSAGQRQSVRNIRTRPLVDAFKSWLDATLARISWDIKKSKSVWRTGQLGINACNSAFPRPGWTALA